MLLQTLVQLNILIFATPALAGWAMLPLAAQPDLVRVACVLVQSRAMEANASPKSAAGVAFQAATRQMIADEHAPIAQFSPVTYRPLATITTESLRTFPRTTRAP